MTDSLLKLVIDPNFLLQICMMLLGRKANTANI